MYLLSSMANMLKESVLTYLSVIIALCRKAALIWFLAFYQSLTSQGVQICVTSPMLSLALG